MTFTLVRIRLKQLARQSTSSVFMYTLMALAAVILAVVSHALYRDRELALYLCCGTVFIVLSLHLSRGDSQFVYRHLSRPQQSIFTEYVIFTLPLSAPALLTAQWYYAGAVTAALFLIARIKTKKKERLRLKWLSSVIPPAHFELLSGFRKSFFYALPCYLVALAFCWVRILPLFFLWLITVQVMSFYARFEPLDILRANDVKTQHLLWFKMLRHSSVIVLLFLPVTLLNAFFNDGFLLINLLFLVLQITLLCFAICYKYSLYTPNGSDSGGIILGLVSISGIVPMLLPLPAIMCVSYYFRARQNLNQYLHD